MQGPACSENACGLLARGVLGVRTRVPRLLHSGDWQLGMKRRYLGEDAQARFDEARFDAIRRIGEIADREGPRSAHWPPRSSGC